MYLYLKTLQLFEIRLYNGTLLFATMNYFIHTGQGGCGAKAYAGKTGSEVLIHCEWHAGPSQSTIYNILFHTEEQFRVASYFYFNVSGS